ncbi:MAG: Vps62-related protein [Methanomassiliicoccales archaeon]|nr:Vps62-related protein [Methanomassiliicoccales archaeon]
MRRMLCWGVAIVLVSLLLLPTLLSAAASGPSSLALTHSEKEDLAASFAPILHFERDERVFPVDVAYFLSCSDLKSAGGSTLISSGLDDGSISSEPYSIPGGGYYLDDRYGGINDDGVIARYEADRTTVNDSVYAHVANSGDSILVQYWMFYVFNYGTFNRHEGDWEMVEYVLDQTKTPIAAVYSQHQGGQRLGWNELLLENGHPVVYVARGSHANFPALGQGPIGPGADIVGADGAAWLAGTDCGLVVLGEKGEGNRPSEQAWLDFAGNWGQCGGTWDSMMGKNGPLGPAYREGGSMYGSASWGVSLTSSSPANEMVGADAVLFVLATAVSFGGIIAAIIWSRRK